MARSVTHYSNFLAGWASLVGILKTRIGIELAPVANTCFNTAIQKIWIASPWLENSPFGEARFLGNRLTYPNNLAKTANWAATAVTVTANSIANPADGMTTASKVMETSANSAHKVVQTVTTFFPSTGYTLSFYARANGRSYVQLAANDGVTAYSCFFNLTTGTVGTNSNFATVTIAQQPNGFYLCQATLTANAAATTSGTYTISLSSDGTTLSYAGDATKGAYVWGALMQQTTNVPVQDSLLAWDQTGENVIDAIFDVYPTSPFTANYPRSLGYNPTPNGIQLINGAPYSYPYYNNGVAQFSIYGPVPPNPVYLYYRKACPSFTGAEFDATAAYAVDQQTYFVNSLGDGDFWKCLVATTAGQSPDTTAASWEVIPLPEAFLQFAIYQAYGDWLISDGAADKAAGAYSVAQDKMADQWDKQSRQMDVGPRTRVSTHLSSRAAV